MNKFIVYAIMLCCLAVVRSSLDTTTQTASNSATPSASATYEETPNLDPLSFTSAVRNYSENGIVALRLPAGWQVQNTGDSTDYIFSYVARANERDASTIILRLKIGTGTDIYQLMADDIQTIGNAPKDLLNALKQYLARLSNYQSSEIKPIKLADLDGYGMEANLTALVYTPAAYSQVRVATLPDGRLLAAMFTAPTLYRHNISVLSNQLMDNIFLNVDALPTITPTATPTSSVSPTPTSSPTALPTLLPSIFDNLDPLSIKSAATFWSPDKVIEIQLPAGWIAHPQKERGLYIFMYYLHENHFVFLRLKIGTLEEISKTVNHPDLSATSAEDYLIEIQELLKTDNRFNLSAVYPTKFGELSAYGLEVRGPLFGWPPYYHSELRLAMLQDGSFIYAEMAGPEVIRERLVQVIDAMFNSLRFNLNNLPTRTPTQVPQ